MKESISQLHHARKNNFIALHTIAIFSEFSKILFVIKYYASASEK